MKSRPTWAKWTASESVSQAGEVERLIEPSLISMQLEPVTSTEGEAPKAVPLCNESSEMVWEWCSGF
jgi:hypothetical protein